MGNKIKSILIRYGNWLDKLDASRYWRQAGTICIFTTIQTAFIALTIFLEEHQIFQSLTLQIFWAITMLVANIYLVIRLCKTMLIRRADNSKIKEKIES